MISTLTFNEAIGLMEMSQYNDNVVGPGDRFNDAYFEIKYVRSYTTPSVAAPTGAVIISSPPQNPTAVVGGVSTNAVRPTAGPPPTFSVYFPQWSGAPQPSPSSGAQPIARIGWWYSSLLALCCFLVRI